MNGEEAKESDVESDQESEYEPSEKDTTSDKDSEKDEKTDVNIKRAARISDDASKIEAAMKVRQKYILKS